MMTEREYLLVSNRVRLTAATAILRDVLCLPNPDDDAKVREALVELIKIEQRLFNLTKTRN